MFLVGRKLFDFNDDDGKSVSKEKLVLIDLSIARPILVADSINLNDIKD